MNRLFRLLPALLASAVMVLCAKSSGDKPFSLFPKEAYAPLTEDDIMLLLKHWPVLESLSERTGYHGPVISLEDNSAQVHSKMIDSLQAMPGLVETLAGRGVEWSVFRGAMYRTVATVLLIGQASSTPELKQAMRYTRPGERKVLKRRIAESDAIVSHVPSDNRDVFERHHRELMQDLWLLQRLTGQY
jgi:hypothetical protein